MFSARLWTPDQRARQLADSLAASAPGGSSVPPDPVYQGCTVERRAVRLSRRSVRQRGSSRAHPQRAQSALCVAEAIEGDRRDHGPATTLYEFAGEGWSCWPAGLNASSAHSRWPAWHRTGLSIARRAASSCSRFPPKYENVIAPCDPAVGALRDPAAAQTRRAGVAAPTRGGQNSWWWSSTARPTAGLLDTTSLGRSAGRKATREQ